MRCHADRRSVDYGQHAARCVVCAVSRQLLAGVASHHVAARIEVVLPVAGGACGHARLRRAYLMAAHGYGLGVEAVGALHVVGVEHGRVVHVAVAEHYGVVEPYEHGGALVLHGEYHVVADAVGGDEVVVRRAALGHAAHRAERAGRAHGGEQRRRGGVRGRVEHEAARVAAVHALAIAARRGREAQRGECRQRAAQHAPWAACGMGVYGHERPSSAFSAWLTRSKWNSPSVCSMSRAILSLHRQPMLPSCVWCMWWSARKVPASISSPTFL